MLSLSLTPMIRRNNLSNRRYSVGQCPLLVSLYRIYHSQEEDIIQVVGPCVNVELTPKRLSTSTIPIETIPGLANDDSNSNTNRRRTSQQNIKVSIKLRLVNIGIYNNFIISRLIITSTCTTYYTPKFRVHIQLRINTIVFSKRNTLILLLAS